MSHDGLENQGTGLRDVYDILVKAPPEQVQSLTFQLGESPEDRIIHAFCLIILQKEEQALSTLQMLGDNHLANHLAETWKMSGGNREDFGIRCGYSHDLTGESLAALARIFKVLSERRLCSAFLRNLAYRRALSTDSQRANVSEEYHPLIEEAKDVCGPQMAAWMCSSGGLKSGFYHDPHSSLDDGNTTLKTDQLQSSNVPSSLLTNSVEPSYPSHLEISIPPTAIYEGDITTPETSRHPTQRASIPEQSRSPAKSQPTSTETPPFKAKDDAAGGGSKMESASAAECRKWGHILPKPEPGDQTTTPTAEPRFTLPTATNINIPRTGFSPEIDDAEEEDDAVFYSFVILHAVEDADLAESMRKKVESAIGREDGATFADDFAIPGKSTLGCVEDAINNSAFTFLLLTLNFQTRMLEVNTDSALINSINNRHKYNTVIPLLPMENSLPRHRMPIVLQTLVALQENSSFERRVKKALSPAKIKQQRRLWAEEQETLKRLNQQRKLQTQQHKRAQLLENLTYRGSVDFSSMPPAWPNHPNIHIENARYIMIGNDSQMTVEYGGATEMEDSLDRDDEK